jgi:hypothetical protein
VSVPAVRITLSKIKFGVPPISRSSAQLNGNFISPELVARHFRQVHDDRVARIGSLEKISIEPNLFFITATFYPSRIGITCSSSLNQDGVTIDRRPGALKEFGLSYFKIAKYLLGKHLGRKATYQPLAYAFLDFEGTRFWRGSAGTNIHVHAVALIHPSTAGRFSMVAMNPEHFKTERMQRLRIERFDPGKSGLEELSSYASKGARSFIRRDRDELWDIFPATIKRSA